MITNHPIQPQSQLSDGGEIVKAMSVGKRLAWATFYAAAGILVIAIGKLYVSPLLGQYATAPHRLAVLSYVLAAAVLPFAAYYLAFAVRIARAGQFPLPNSSLWTDTAVVRGAQARAYARRNVVIALILVSLAAGISLAGSTLS